MLDIQLMRSKPEFVEEKLKIKGFDIKLSDFLTKDKERRDCIARVEAKKAERNRNTALIPQMKKAGEDVTETLLAMKLLSDEIKELDAYLGGLEAEINDFMLSLPNLPADDVVAGGKENNVVVESFGSKPEFSFAPQHHVDLAERLGLIDYARGVKLSGNGFWIYKNFGARLEWALLNYFTEVHLRDGYQMTFVPHILNEVCGLTAGQLPKFRDDLYWFQTDANENKAQFVLPTAETALVNLHRDEILDESVLPLKYFAYTPCYRKEAGSYRAEERGMIRGHQFNKIEMFQYAHPDHSEEAFQELVKKACDLMSGLGLHFRLSKLAAEDCSASMAKTYDIEVWIPSMNDYKEVSSASNAMDYQARRGNIRMRKADGSMAFAHTLNASGLATSRIFPAILEQNQCEDGSVRIPDVLRKYMDGMTHLRA